MAVSVKGGGSLLALLYIDNIKQDNNYKEKFYTIQDGIICNIKEPFLLLDSITLARRVEQL